MAYDRVKISEVKLNPKYCQVIVDRMRKLDPSLEIKRNGHPYEPKTKA